MTDTPSNPSAAHQAAAQRELVSTLAPLLARIARLAPATRHDRAAVHELEHTLEREFPATGEFARALGQAIERGIGEGWLCSRGEPHARFSRLAKPSPDTHQLSIDVVSLAGRAVRHTHPQGEVTLGFAASGGQSPLFDGRPPGWVFLGPGSTHTPEVTGGRMHLIYFLPDGDVQWHADAT